MARRCSSGNSTCTLPSIPEYPGFQDTKDLGRTRLENPPNASYVVQNRSLGCSATDHFTESHCETYNHFCDKSLQDYFNERLTELRNYEPKISNGKMKGTPNENQTPNDSSESSRRGSDCSAEIQTSHTKLTDESYDSADPVDKSMAPYSDQGDSVQNTEDCCKRDYLEWLTTSVNGPLEMLLQRK